MGRVLAISSGGGHFVELLAVKDAFREHELVYASVDASYADDVRGHRYHPLVDATRWSPHRVVFAAAQILRILLMERPDIVVSTGAAHGYLALRMAKRLGARTIWLDSIANAEELSGSGAKVEKYADLWLTQWPHLERPEGPTYAGAIL